MPIDAPIHTNESVLPRVLAAGLPVVLVFWSRDCPACDQVMPTLDDLARAYAGQALVVKINAGEEPGLVRRYSVGSSPTTIFIKGGREEGRAIGAARQSALCAWLDYLVGATAVRPAVPSGPRTPLPAESAVSRPAPSAQPDRERERGAARRDAGQGSGQPLVLTDATFDQVIRGSRGPVLVDFWAEWCGPCKMIAPAVADLAREFAGRAVVAKLNVDQNPRTATRFDVMSIPTLLIFGDGRVVDQLVGVQPPHVLRQRLARHLA
jgi:thioredoxin 1